MMWPWRRRHRSTPPAPPPPPPPRNLRDAEDRTVDLEKRADRVADTLMDRLRRNNFADGIAVSWGQPARHRRGSV